jgi:hypothetical protein
VGMPIANIPFMQRIMHRMHLVTTIRMLSGFNGKNSVCALGG